VTILGIGDDLFDIRWRHKFFIPAFAAIPILIVYFVDFNVTQIIVPLPLRNLLYPLTQLQHNPPAILDLGLLYYFYMAAISIFCPNSINILAGINGLEVGQSIVIALLLIFNDALYLLVPSYPHPATDSHLFSIYLLLPFLAVSIPLYMNNKYPARVFVGDTYCYFAGMVFAVVGILGHFSKTLLLLFVPQIINFIYSAPQLFRIIPCPRHRLPHFNARTGLLEPSTTKWDAAPPSPLQTFILTFLERVKLLSIVRDEDGKITESSNFTLINLWLVWFGPRREDQLTRELLVMQTIVGGLGLFVRHNFALLIFEVDNLGRWQ